MGSKKVKKKSYRILKIVLLIILILFLGGYIYFNVTYPVTNPSPDIEINSSPDLIQRGQYLVNNVAACISCHSTRDWTKFSGPVIAGTEGMGGEKFEDGLPGIFYAGNITPSGIGDWTNGDLLRAITTGVTRDNRVLYPIMPYPEYHNLTMDDLYSIIGYLRTLEPRVNEVPLSSIDFPMNFIIKTIPPRSYIPITTIDESNSNDYGKYLVTIAACATCHSPMEDGKFINDMNFAGGVKFLVAGKEIASSNITPDIETGIGTWTKDDFLNSFRKFVTPNNSENPKDLNTAMPWFAYSGMTDKDLGAIYDYLKTVPPVHNKIEKSALTKK